MFDNYWVWYSETATPSNPDVTVGADNADKGWEYVGKQGSTFKTFNGDDYTSNLSKDQYIKYWDYSATDYRFVAGSPIKSFDFQPSSGQVEITTTTVKGLAGHINPNPIGGTVDEIKPNPVYLAKPKIITDTDENTIIDHINRDKLDNRKENFRYATKSENRINSKTRTDNVSGIQGVRFEEGKWRVRISVNGKYVHLGMFNDFEEAVKTRLKAEKKYYGEFAMQINLFEKYGIA